jgi:hypothetical protein
LSAKRRRYAYSVAGCIFDGVSPTTNAHIFRAAWLRNLFATADVFRHVHVRHEPGHASTRECRKEPDFKLNCACDGCNSGWMEARDLAGEEVFTTAVARGNSVKRSRPANPASSSERSGQSSHSSLQEHGARP